MKKAVTVRGSFLRKRELMKKKFVSGILALLLTVGGLPACYFDVNAFMSGGSSSQSREDSSDSEKESSSGSSSKNEESSSESASENEGDIVTENLSIHFLELGNKYTGDCTLIKVGNTEILIDAGSRKSSAATIVPYVQKYCTDGVLEYVIATHAHQDHIAGFVGTTTAKGIFESFVCETIIDYPMAPTEKTVIRSDYETKRDEEVRQGATHYTALECWKEENGASRSYVLSEDVTMQILYQRYYEETSNDENEYSVCMLLSEGDNHYLFTGDLEGKGEESLVRENDLPECVLFKSGHHGSPTSNTDALLSVIKPQIVCVCCCCGSTEYTTNVANLFPSQAFVDRVAPYTDRVYVTTTIDDNNGYRSMNGNIVVTSRQGDVSVEFSNNDLKFKDTDWFKKNRTCPDEWK